MSGLKKIAISLFSLTWLAVFHYESLRLNYLSRWAGRELPKLKFLYPPAGWIMFFRVDEPESRAEVYGIKNREPELIDPHDIFKTRWIGYDNIRRNVLISALHPSRAHSFCNSLRRKFPQYQTFSIVQVYFPSYKKDPDQKFMQEAYRCGTPY